MLNTCFPSGRLEFGYVPGRGRLCDNRPRKTLGIESPTSFTDGQYFTHVVTTCCGGIKCILCDSLGGETWKLMPGFSGLYPCAVSLWKLCLVSFRCNKSEPWVWLHTESCESSEGSFKPGGDLGTSQNNLHHLVALKNHFLPIFILKNLTLYKP